LIILGLSLSFFPGKQEVRTEIKPISMERSCLVEALYNECRNCSNKEKSAVAEVILNRTKHKNYPSTICKVVQQPYQMSYRNNSKANAKLLPEFETLNYY
jgi:spore germination cell wall hydrolase CwlJ-like protein